MAHHIPTLLQPASPLILGTLRPMPLSSLLSFTSYPCRLVCYQPYKQPDLFNSSIAVNGLYNAEKLYRPCMSLSEASVPLDSHSPNTCCALASMGTYPVWVLATAHLARQFPPYGPPNHETRTENNFTTELVLFVSILVSISTSQTEIWGSHMVVVSLHTPTHPYELQKSGKPRAHVRRRMSWARRMPLRLLVRQGCLPATSA